LSKEEGCPKEGQTLLQGREIRTRASQGGQEAAKKTAWPGVQEEASAPASLELLCDLSQQVLALLHLFRELPKNHVVLVNLLAHAGELHKDEGGPLKIFGRVIF